MYGMRTVDSLSSVSYTLPYLLLHNHKMAVPKDLENSMV